MQASTLLVLASLRSGLLFGIGEGRCSHHVVGIRRLKTRDETLTDAGVHGAVGRVGLVRKAGKIFLDEGLP
jgi:hypothetical protein